jgi:hypothetical protein
VPQEGPATYDVIFVNTGNVGLSITADDGIGTFILGLGVTKTFVVSDAGPFSGLATADNTVTATGSYTDDSENPWTSEQPSSVSCTVGARLNVLKLTDGNVDSTYDWNFAIYAGAYYAAGSGFLGDAPLATDATLGDTDGILDFDNLNLDSDQAYTVCEIPVNATVAWSSEWSINGQIVPPYNPHSFDLQPQHLGYHCVDIGFDTGYLLTAGDTLSFTVNNSFPGGDPRTPGYWKNWSSCSGGGQYEKATGANDPENEFWTLDELLYEPGFMIGNLALGPDQCEDGVSILNQNDISTGKRMSNDAAYTLAMHLFAYELNQAAGACGSTIADSAGAAGQALLVRYGFDGTGGYLRPKGQTKNDYYYALELAEILDQYNNGLLCGDVTTGGPQEGTVSGHIYEDTNGDGTLDSGEPGIAGVDVEISDSQGGTRTVTTDANGDYSATIPAGSTTVDIVEATLPAGFTQTDGTDPTTMNVIANVDNYIGVDGYKPSILITNTMHIGSLEGEPIPGSRGKWNAEVTVTLHIEDHSDLTIPGATVSGSWSGGAKGSDTCVTDGSGQCTITKSNIRGDNVTFSVTGVSLAGYTYNDGENHVSSISVSP